MKTQTGLRRLAPAEAMRSSSEHAVVPDVDAILEDVRLRGDAAMRDYARSFGDPPPRRIASDEMEAACARIDPALRDALVAAAKRIERFARAQRSALHDVEVDLGSARVGHRAIPLRRVGIYVPSGTYPLPSTLLMCAVPARVAGVGSIVACTPRPNDAILAAAHVAGVDEMHAVGGAQAIAALAFGTRSIARVDTIAGPGNAYVAAAKRAVFGICGIDAIAGPSEVLIIASRDADPERIVADLIAQAEHDVSARAMLITEDEALAKVVDSELERGLEQTATRAAARAALDANGWCCVASLEEAVEIANAVAPEHLELHGAAAESLAQRLHAYGTLFVGSAAAEVFGDYGSGPNHVLPTAGTARFSAGLSVFSFLAIRTYERGQRAPDPEFVAQTATLAGAEGLDGHRRAALVRQKPGNIN
jgi:histidinol dehydrogenase